MFFMSPTASQVETAAFTEWRISFTDVDWVNLAVRRYRDGESGEMGDEVEVEWMVGPIPGEKYTEMSLDVCLMDSLLRSLSALMDNWKR